MRKCVGVVEVVASIIGSYGCGGIASLARDVDVVLNVGTAAMFFVASEGFLNHSHTSLAKDVTLTSSKTKLGCI